MDTLGTSLPAAADAQIVVAQDVSDQYGSVVPPAAAPASISRRHDLDALRAIAMLLGIALHGALSYIPMPDQGWPVHDARQNDLFAHFTSIVHGFRMPLFFLISGFFTAMLWRKRGLGALLLHRLKRIFFPLAICMFTLVPLTWFVMIGAGIAAASRGEGQNDLWTAAAKGNNERVAQLLEAGADVNERGPKFSATALSIAARHGQIETVQQLIAAGADVNARDRDGATPLHGAVMFNRPKVAQALINHGVDLGARNRLGETAPEMLSVGSVRMLIAAGMGGVSCDLSSRRDRIAPILAQADPALESYSRHTSVDNQTNQQLAGLFLLLTMFPLFHHLWFLWFLCWLVAAFAIYVAVTGSMHWRLPDWLVLSPLRYAWLIPLTILPQALMGTMYPNFGPDTSTGLIPMPQILFYHAIFFFFGAMYFDRDDSGGQLGRWWMITVPMAMLVVFPLGNELSTGAFGFLSVQWLDSPWCRPAAIVLQVVYVWMMSFGLMGMFRSLFSSESKTMRYISDSSYWLYLAHLPPIIFAQAVVRDWQIPALAKFTFVCVATSLLLLASYQWMVRYTPIGTLLNGPRQRPQKASTLPPFAPSVTGD